MVLTKEEAKEELKKLIDDFNNNPKKEHLTEEETRSFISKFFEILGWSFTKGEVSQEEKISKGYVDYGFKINGIPKMFVEAKKTSNDITEDKDIQQAITYALYKATTWAVLTNFKRIRVFNAEIRGSLREARVLDIYLEDSLNRFDDLWMLSKEGFEQGLLDRYAEEHCKKATKRAIEAQLFEDLNSWRDYLAKDIKKNYEKEYDSDTLDEIIQNLLNRFILIRKIEDAGLEGMKLKEAYNLWAAPENKKPLWHHLKYVFEYYDENYDSKIFDRQKNELDRIEIDDYPLKIILPQLYTSADQTIAYDFSLIPADVLGNIYEQYLGSILKATEKRAKITNGAVHRKEQGVYYTPTYVVDYIVKNTLGERLKECKKPQDVEKIKVLDPACGSGSFLIRAFDEIYSWYDKNGFAGKAVLSGDEHKGFETVKDNIIKSNLFGVDLDSKAVEIAQLNLLLKTADKKHKLPQLKENIKHGNSLIDDKNISPQAFDWKSEFKSTMDKGGFDVVIGNPPYVTKELSEKDRAFFNEHYSTGSSNLYKIFIERALSLLKDGGYFGFIVPNSYLSDNSSVELRKILLEKAAIRKIVLFSESAQVFDNVIQAVTILIFQKLKKPSEIEILEFHDNSAVRNLGTNIFKYEKIPQQQYLELADYSYPFILSKEKLQILKKLNEQKHKLKDYVKIYREVNDKLYPCIRNERGVKNYPMVRGRDVSNWQVVLPKEEQQGSWFDRECLKKDRSDAERLVIQHVSNQAQIKRLKVALIPKQVYCHDSTYAISVNEVKKLRVVLAMLNSKLLNYYFKSLSSTNNITTPEIEDIPSPDLDKVKTDEIDHLSEKMLSFNKKLQELGDKQTNERQEIEDDIKKTDEKIDELVYKLYGITEEEKRIIEDSLK